MACIRLYLYIVVLYQNGGLCLLRKRNGPVREKRRGLLWVVAVPVGEGAEWVLCHLGLFCPFGVVPLIIRGARVVWCYFAKYNGGIFYNI